MQLPGREPLMPGSEFGMTVGAPELSRWESVGVRIRKWEHWLRAGVQGGVLDKADLPQGSELGTRAGPSLVARLALRLPPSPHSALEQEPVVSGVSDL